MKISKFLLSAVLAVSSLSMLTVSSDAEARRMGGGSSFGRQSSNITRSPITPPAASPTARQNAMPASAASRTSATPPQQRSGFSRFLGPIAGIAAGLGIASLLSSFGLSGAFLEFVSSALLIAALGVGVMFIIRRLRGGARQETAYAGYADMAQKATPSEQPYMQKQASSPVFSQANDETWFIPADFDKVAFLQESKKQFIAIQALWDKGDVQELRHYLTDDLLQELTPLLASNRGETEVVILNAELLGIEKLQESFNTAYLASVRFSGMLREEEGAEATRFEEVWNLYKQEKTGWLLAGIQQIEG